VPHFEAFIEAEDLIERLSAKQGRLKFHKVGPGGGEDEAEGAAALLEGPGLLLDHVEGGGQEPEGLAGPRLGHRDHVEPRQDDRPALRGGGGRRRGGVDSGMSEVSWLVVLCRVVCFAAGNPDGISISKGRGKRITPTKGRGGGKSPTRSHPLQRCPEGGHNGMMEVRDIVVWNEGSLITRRPEDLPGGLGSVALRVRCVSVVATQKNRLLNGESRSQPDSCRSRI